MNSLGKSYEKLTKVRFFLKILRKIVVETYLKTYDHRKAVFMKTFVNGWFLNKTKRCYYT